MKAIMTNSAVPDAEEIRRALARIVASSGFSNSGKLTGFLRFVVETALEGRGDRIKGYTIAIEALGRGSDFDPQTDAIVRVSAIRVRRALARYYATEGVEDALEIALPCRRYVPHFSRRSAPSSRPAAADAEPARSYRREIARLRKNIEALKAEVEATRTVLGQTRGLLASMRESATTLEDVDDRGMNWSAPCPSPLR